MDHATVYDVNDVYVDSDFKDFQLQNDQLLNSMIDYHYYSKYRDKELRDSTSVELFLIGSCKANCEYCYLKKHPELYPSSLQNMETILKNLEAFLDFYKEQKFYCNLDIFSAEWLTTPYADKVFSIIYEKFKDEDEYKPRRLLMADNGRFLLNEKSYNTFFDWKNRLRTIGINSTVSISIDGKYCDDGRTPLTDEDYKKIFDVAKEHSWRCHPMVSSSNISNWKENYVWWLETAPEEVGETLMMLEVRDHTWTKDKIKEYLEFLDFEIDYQFHNIFKENKRAFMETIMRSPVHNAKIEEKPWLSDRSYDNISLVFDLQALNKEEHFNCTLCNQFVVRLGDLSFAPCHRLYYPELKIGNYEKDENGKITGVHSVNPQMMLIKTATKKSCLPHCENCEIFGFCGGFCAGASYERCGDMLTPPKEVCDLYKAKASFLVKKYNSMGLFDDLEELLNDNRPVRFNTKINAVYRYITSKINQFKDKLNITINDECNCENKGCCNEQTK